MNIYKVGGVYLPKSIYSTPRNPKLFLFAPCRTHASLSRCTSRLDGSGRSSQSLRGTLLQHIRREPIQLGESVPGLVHAHLRGPEGRGSPEYRGQTHQPSLPAVPARRHHRRLPAFRRRRRSPRLRQRQSPARWRTPRSQVQPDVPFDANTTGKLLCAE